MDSSSLTALAEELSAHTTTSTSGRAADTVRSANALDELVRWVAAGGEWRALSVGPPARISLVTCDGGEEMARIESEDPSFVAYVQARVCSVDPGDSQEST